MFRAFKHKKVELFFIVTIIFVFIIILLGCVNLYNSSQTVYKQSNENLLLRMDKMRQSSNNYFLYAERTVEDGKLIIEKTINYNKINEIAPIAYKYNKKNIPYIHNYLNQVIGPSFLNLAARTDGLMSIYFNFDYNFMRNKNIIGVWYIDKNNDEKFESIDNGLASDMLPKTNPDLEWFYKPRRLKKGVWSKPYVDMDIKIDMITYSVPIYSNKKFIGIVGADISMEKIKDFICKFKLYKTGKAYLIGSDGKIIFAKDYKTSDSAAIIDKNLYDCLYCSCKNYFAGLDKEIKLVDSVSADKLFAITSLYNGMFLVAEVSKKELYGDINELFKFASYSILFAVIISLFIALRTYLIIKRINNELVHKEKLISMGIMAAKMAHEINNPLGYINCNIDTLKKFIEKIKILLSSYDKSLDNILNKKSNIKTELENIQGIKSVIKLNYTIESLDDIIEESKDGIKRVSEIVVNLKNFAKNDNADVKLDESLAIIIDESLVILGNKLKNNVEIVKHISEIPDLCCNKNQLKQVLVNIIDNAYQALQEKNISDRKISISLHRKGKNAFIEIEDNGIGIEKNKINRIFDAFFTTKPQGKGTGLGLSVAYEIVTNKHNGEILVESKKGKGTKFMIKLPY